jgi:hypothetical protein
MSVYPNGRVGIVDGAVESTGAKFITRCRCGRRWNVTMERGKPGHAGFVKCSCEAEIVAWSGTVVFRAVPIDAD